MSVLPWIVAAWLFGVGLYGKHWTMMTGTR